MMLRHTVTALVAILVGATASPAWGGAVRPGFSAFTLAPNDDDSTASVQLGFTVDFFGVTFNRFYVNNNGNITFDVPMASYTPFDLTSTGRQIIAPFFSDVDTRYSGSPVTYGPGVVNGRLAYGVNWVQVDCYHSDPARPTRNSFQLVLIERSDTGPGNFDLELNYDTIVWESGQASGGDASCMGGFTARAGFSNGTGEDDTFFELPGSAVPGAFVDSGPAETALIHNSMNSDVLGRYTFPGRHGSIIIDCPDADEDEICDEDDNCPYVYNPGQEDADGDGIGDACDPCPNHPGGEGNCDPEEEVPCEDGAGNDEDGDGVCDNRDFCPGTVLPESVPRLWLGVNRWADVDGDGVFDTRMNPGGGRGPQLSFTIADTGGCSCEQIIEAMGLGKGHRKFGCSIGVMRKWVKLVSRSNPGTTTSSGCSVAGSEGAGAGALVLIGLALALRRRRAR